MGVYRSQELPVTGNNQDNSDAEENNQPQSIEEVLGWLRYFTPKLPDFNPTSIDHYKTNVALDCASLKFYTSSNIKNFSFTFEYESLVIAKIKIYFLCEEELGERNYTKSIKQIRVAKDKPRKKVTTLIVKPGNACLVDLSQYGIFYCLDGVPEDFYHYNAKDHPNRYAMILSIEEANQKIDDNSDVDSMLIYFSFTYILSLIHCRLEEDSLLSEIVNVKSNINKNGYITDEIYGIHPTESKECLICMINLKSTVLLPCRHMCICNECAMSLRLQTNKCPVCRSLITNIVKLSGDLKYMKLNERNSNSVRKKPIEESFSRRLSSVSKEDAQIEMLDDSRSKISLLQVVSNQLRYQKRADSLSINKMNTNILKENSINEEGDSQIRVESNIEVVVPSGNKSDKED